MPDPCALFLVFYEDCKSFINLGLSHLEPQGTLTADTLMATAQKSKLNSRARQLHCQNLSRLAKFANIEIDLTPYQGHYSPKKEAARDIPNDAAIESNIHKLKSAAWQWVYAMMATYGLRDHEAFFCNVEWQWSADKWPSTIRHSFWRANS